MPSVEHFEHPELAPLLREIWQPVAIDGYGWTREYPERKQWEVAMAVRALRDHGAVRPDAEILGVGAGIEPTLFVLTEQVRRVFATDLYLDPGDWTRSAKSGVLADPKQFWPGSFDVQRLVVQHMNALELRYPDNSFDGVFSSSSIEHFGDLDDVSRAMDEIYRVLRPGGVVSLSTEFRLEGPPPGLPDILMFDRQQIDERIIGDRDWRLVGGDLDLTPSTATLEVRVQFSQAAEEVLSGAPHWSVYPHLVLEEAPRCWTSVHLVLRKVSSRSATAAAPMRERATQRALRSPMSAPDSHHTQSQDIESAEASASAGQPADPRSRVAAPPGVELVGLGQLSELLRRAEEIGARDGFTERWEYLERYRLDYDAGALPDDPFSEEYRNAQIELYRAIAGVSDYKPSVNEVMSADVDELLRRPAPFNAGSTAAAGDHLIAYGFVFRLLNLHPGDRVLEYGAGQGNIALLLATMGLDVTAIDISPDYIELIRRRAARDEVSLNAVVGEFGEPPPDNKPVDAILFFEAFHHSLDHVRLVRSLRELLAPGGRVVFAGEPILESPEQPWIGPWGVRLDGVSLGAIRQDQCFELGFTTSYFLRMLMRNGFSVTFHPCADSFIGNSWIARLTDGVIAPNQMLLPPDEEQSWGPGQDPSEPQRFAGSMTRLTLDDDPRWRFVNVRLRNYLPVDLAATVSTGTSRREVVLTPAEDVVVELPLPGAPRTLIIESATAVPAELGISDDQTPLGLAVVEIKMER